MVKTIMSLLILIANEILGPRVLAANKVGDVEGGKELQCVKLKTRRSESQKLSKF